MKGLLLLLIHIAVVSVRLARPGGIRGLVAENLLMKQQLLVLSRSRRRAPNLTSVERFVLGLCTLHDPLFEFRRWQANPRILDIEPVETVPNVPVSHPFVERLIGSVRRELLDQTFFWNSLDLERKLGSFRDYFNESRVHSSLGGQTPAEVNDNRKRQRADIRAYRWESHCGGLYQLPVAA